MSEKDKNYIEFSMHSMIVTHMPYQEDAKLAITGMIPIRETLTADNPFDIPCEVVMVPKREFERLQAIASSNAELARQWEINHDLLLKKIGFDTVEELVNYIYDDGPNSQGDLKTLKEIIYDAEANYISERDKAEVLQTENEQLKKKLEEFSPVPGYREFFKSLCPGKDVEKLVWTTEQLCCGRDLRHALQVDLEYYRTLSSARQAKYTCDEWCSANSKNNSWKAAAECNSPKELIEKLNLLRDDISGRSTVIKSYKRDIEKWQKATGCPTPEAANILIRDYKDTIQKWKVLTKCETPEAAATWITSYESACERGNKLAKEMDAWQKATGRADPEAAKQYIDRLKGRLNKIHDYSVDW